MPVQSWRWSQHVSETLVSTYKSTRRFNPEDQHRHLQRRENLRSVRSYRRTVFHLTFCRAPPIADWLILTSNRTKHAGIQSPRTEPATDIRAHGGVLFQRTHEASPVDWHMSGYLLRSKAVCHSTHRRQELTHTFPCLRVYKVVSLMWLSSTDVSVMRAHRENVTVFRYSQILGFEDTSILACTFC
jgi:hypothetical protein